MVKWLCVPMFWGLCCGGLVANETEGLAAKYPQDAGIGRDAAVLFHEDFEDGELDCWIDGQKCGEFRGINWRSSDALKVNKVTLSLWLEPAAYARSGGGTTRTVWYDDIVVATRYIGPKVDR